MKKQTRRRKQPTQATLIQKGIEIIKNGQILHLGNGRYKVSSQSYPGMFYDVTVLDHAWKCSCAYHIHGNSRVCKHIISVQNLVEVFHNVKHEIKIIPMIEPTCTSCKSKNCKFRERRNKKHGGVSIMYKCFDCGKKFVHAPGFVGRHYDEDTITCVLFEIAAGSTPEKVSEKHKKDKIKINPSTIYHWMKYYSRILKYFSDKIIAPRAGGKWCADEIHYKLRGNSEWLFGVMEYNSRFIIDYDSSNDKIHYDATSLFSNTIHKTKKIPDILITDKLRGFSIGHKNIMKRHKKTSIHRKNAGISKIHMNNNVYERFNGTFKECIKIARGFHTRIPARIELFLAYYNLFRPHSGIDKKTPAEYLGIVIEGHNKWKTAIQYAVLHCM